MSKLDKKIKVTFVSAECKPFSKVGGIGDVVGELPAALIEAGVDVRVITPGYGETKDKKPELFQKKEKCVGVHYQGETALIDVYTGKSDVPTTLVGNDTYFGGEFAKPYFTDSKIPFYDDTRRFSFFSQACLQLIREDPPDIVHAHDWHSAYLLGLMVDGHHPAKRVFTAHNIEYQGVMHRPLWDELEISKLGKHPLVKELLKDPHTDWNCINPMRLGLEIAHRSNTVSKTYLEEMTHPEDPSRYFSGGKGLEDVARSLVKEGRLCGILNGFQYDTKSVISFEEKIKQKLAMKQQLATRFTNPEGFLVGFVGRAVDQKFKLLTEYVGGKSVLEHILEIPGVNVAILTTGDKKYEQVLGNLHLQRHPGDKDYDDILWNTKNRGNYFCRLAFDDVLRQQISLGSDAFLVPSVFEPCGITQLEALSHATPPIVRLTGGLADTVRSYERADGTGFVFDGNTHDKILWGLVNIVREAKKFHDTNPTEWKALQERAYAERFTWQTAAKAYIEQLYKPALLTNW